MAVPLKYNARNKPFAQTLRREMTKQECHLWYDYLRSCPLRFRRQKQFGNYIVDFYCAEAGLVVEIDGSQHYEPEEKARDEARTEYLNSLGLAVVRFGNYDVDQHFDSVCATIDALVRKGEVLPPPTCYTPPSRQQKTAFPSFGRRLFLGVLILLIQHEFFKQLYLFAVFGK